MLFIDNKYTNLYYKIINKALQENRVKSNIQYYENHHIIPRSLGGVDNKENTVLLTGREHYICHKLLVKMTTGEAQGKMKYAIWIIIKGNSYQEPINISSRTYEQIKEDYSKEVSKTKLGTPCPENVKEKIRQTSKGRVFGKRLTPAWYKAHEKTHKGKKDSEETRKKKRRAQQLRREREKLNK